jgi:hypothetical protein
MEKLWVFSGFSAQGKQTFQALQNGFDQKTGQ